MPREAHRNRRAVGLVCGCGHSWAKHGRCGCSLRSCECRSRIVSFVENLHLGTARIVIDVPLAQGPK